MSDEFDFAGHLAAAPACWFCGREAAGWHSLLLELRAPAEGQPAPATIEAWPRRRLFLVPRGDQCAAVHERLAARTPFVQVAAVLPAALLAGLLPLADVLRGLVFLALALPAFVLAGAWWSGRGARAAGLRPSHDFVGLARLHALEAEGWRQHHGRSRRGDTLANEGVKQARDRDGRDLLAAAFSVAASEGAGATA